MGAAGYAMDDGKYKLKQYSFDLDGFSENVGGLYGLLERAYPKNNVHEDLFRGLKKSRLYSGINYFEALARRRDDASAKGDARKSESLALLIEGRKLSHFGEYCSMPGCPAEGTVSFRHGPLDVRVALGYRLGKEASRSVLASMLSGGAGLGAADGLPEPSRKDLFVRVMVSAEDRVYDAEEYERYLALMKAMRCAQRDGFAAAAICLDGRLAKIGRFSTLKHYGRMMLDKAERKAVDKYQKSPLPKMIERLREKAMKKLEETLAKDEEEMHDEKA